MNHVFDVLKKQLGKHITFEQSEEDEDYFVSNSFEIYHQESGESLGTCVLDSDGNLKEYYLIEETVKGHLTSKDMLPIAEDFIKQCYPHGLKAYKLQSVIDLDDSYMVTYGIKDERYGLDLPGIGMTLTITTAGEVVAFEYDHDPVSIEYPKAMLTAEEAKEKYASLIHFEKAIVYTDKETYVNGDDTYRVVYSVREAAIDIPASGEHPVVVEEGNIYTEVKKQDVPFSSLHELVGITEEHLLLGEQDSEDCIIEKWMHHSLPFPETIDYTEFYAEQMITIHFDIESKKPVAIYNGEAYTKDEEELDQDELQKYALDALFLMYPQANKHFMQEVDEYVEEDWIEDVEEYEEEWEEDEFEGEEIDEMIEDEESFPFYFQYHVNGIPVEDCVTCIQIGVYSGNIINASIEPMNERELTSIQTESTLSIDEVKELFMSKVTMELSMAREFNEEGESYYIPTYLPAFTETVGHIHMIDAETGKAYDVDVGDTLFF